MDSQKLAEQLGLESVEELEVALDALEGIAEDGGELDPTNISREARIRAAYMDWCKKFDKKADEARFANFSTNFLAMEEYANENDKEMVLNEYADFSEEEYKSLQAPTEEAVVEPEPEQEPEPEPEPVAESKPEAEPEAEPEREPELKAPEPVVEKKFSAPEINFTPPKMDLKSFGDFFTKTPVDVDEEAIAANKAAAQEAFIARQKAAAEAKEAIAKAAAEAQKETEKEKKARQSEQEKTLAKIAADNEAFAIAQVSYLYSLLVKGLN